MSAHRAISRPISALVIAGAVLLSGCSRHVAGASSASTAAAADPSGTASAPGSAATAGTSGAAISGSSPGGAAASGPSPGVVAAHPDLVFLAGAAFDECTLPAQPAVPPSGATATPAQLLVSQSAARAFDAATNAYLACVDQAGRTFTQRYARSMTVVNLRDIQQLQTKVHNAAVDVDQAVADRFNQQLRIFKARGHTP